MKDEAGAVFTITLPSALRPMGSWWPNGAVFPPPLAPATWTYPSPDGHATSVLGVRPVRVERHNPWSVATLRQTIARVLLRQLSGCPFCGAPFLYHSSISKLLEKNRELRYQHASDLRADLNRLKRDTDFRHSDAQESPTPLLHGAVSGRWPRKLLLSGISLAAFVLAVV